ncbi:hypothetical protein pb186bvf_005705 [Paramecium bursaria]
MKTLVNPQIQIKQVRSNSFTTPNKPYEKRRSSQEKPQEMFNQTFECKYNDPQSSWSTGQDFQDQNQILQALEQQIQINQQQEAQIQQLRELNYRLQNQNEYNHVLKQLNAYKEVIEQLEIKINEIIGENENLTQFNEKLQKQINFYQKELEKYMPQQSPKKQDEGRCISQLDYLKKCKRLEDENKILKQTNFHLEQEMIELRQSLENFKQSVVALKIQHSLKTSQCETDRTQYHYELENQVLYLQQLIEVDSMKMIALEEKLSLLNKENIRLQDNLKRKK